MKNIKRYILFWDAILCATYLLLVFILHLCGLTFRIYIREPVTMIIGLSAVAGVFQLLIKLIHKKVAKIISIVIWSLASIAIVGYGFLFFAFYTKQDLGAKKYSDGKYYVEELEQVMWDADYRYYEDHGPLVRAEKLAYSTDPYEYNQFSEETAKMFNQY